MQRPCHVAITSSYGLARPRPVRIPDRRCTGPPGPARPAARRRWRASGSAPLPRPAPLPMPQAEQGPPRRTRRDRGRRAAGARVARGGRSRERTRAGSHHRRATPPRGGFGHSRRRCPAVTHGGMVGVNLLVGKVVQPEQSPHRADAAPPPPPRAARHQPAARLAFERDAPDAPPRERLLLRDGGDRAAHAVARGAVAGRGSWAHPGEGGWPGLHGVQLCPSLLETRPTRNPACSDRPPIGHGATDHGPEWCRAEAAED